MRERKNVKNQLCEVVPVQKKWYTGWRYVEEVCGDRSCVEEVILS